MSNCRSKKRKGLYFLGVFMLVMAFCIPVAAGVAEEEGEYEIYPTPHSIEYGSGSTALTSDVDVTYGTGIDAYTQTRVEETLEVLDLKKSTSVSNDHTKLTIGIYGSDDAADTYGKAHNVDAAVYNEFDAYTLWVAGNNIVILGKNTDAAYYGVTTLKHIFEQLEENSIRELTIKDYSDIEFRGFIEGYYGNPWSHEDRIDLMEFGGEIKMNQYVYAPKDDPMHNSRWRDQYDEEGLSKVTALAQAGNENKCFFVYALHPFMNNPLTEANYSSDLVVLKAKFKQVIDAGVRQIAILEDDASANGRWSATTLARLLTDVTNWLKELKSTTYPDLKTDLLFCPGWMAYANGMNDSNNDDVVKIKNIYNGSPDTVRIIMTGGKVWGEVNDDFSDRFYAKMAETAKGGGYPYLWVNWPCNDNTKNSQIMGGHNYILHEGIHREKYQGIILNPIQESEPSKVGIFTAADFCWKIWQEEAEGDQAWEDSFKYIDHMTPIETEESRALKEVAKHQIAQDPNQPQAPFEESVELKPMLDDFTEKWNGNTLTADDIETLKAEFQKIADASTYYMEEGTNRRMASQMTPFLSCLRDEAQADICLMDSVKAILSGNGSVAYDKFSEAQMIYERSKTYSFLYYDQNNPPTYQQTLYAKAGRKYIAPFTETMLESVSDEMKNFIDPENVPFTQKVIFQIGGSTSAGSTEGTLTNATDGNLATSYLLKTNQQVGDYVGMTFTIPVSIENIEIYLAINGHENDYIAEGIMEYTTDGKKWQAFEDNLQPESGTDVKVNFETPMELRGFRWKSTGLGGKARWIAIREIGYNVKQMQDVESSKYEATFSRTEGWTLYNSTSDANMTDGDDASEAYYKTVSNSSSQGEYIQLDLGEVKEVGLVRAVVGGNSKAGDKWSKYHLEYSETGTADSWTALDRYVDTEDGAYAYEVDLKGASARYLKLINDETVNKWVIFCGFEAYPVLDTEPEPEGDIMDYTNTKDAGWRVEYGEASSRVIPKNDAVLQPGEYIGLKLSRIRAVTDIIFTGSNTEQLSLEKSVNRAEWSSADNSGMARYIRLMNKTSQPVRFDLNSFIVNSDEILLLTNINGEKNSSDARYLGTTRNWTDGELSTAATYCGVPNADSYLIYDLGKEINISSLKLWISKDSLDYPRDAVVQAGTALDENADWKDILVIGDGQEDTSTTNKTAADNGWSLGTGAVGVLYAYQGTEITEPVTARYIRLKFTAANAERWIELSELEINNSLESNDGRELFPNANNPAIETNAEALRGYGIQNLKDGNLMTAFQPAGAADQSGYLIYHLSDTVDIGKINILQSGNSISNASVSVRTGTDTWKTIGQLDQSLSSFDTTDFDAIYAVKVEWNGKKPIIYEISVLVGPKLDAANAKMAAANQAISGAESALSSIKNQIAAAVSKVNSAKTPEDKLRAEAELQGLYAKQAAAEAAVAEKKAAASVIKAVVSRLEAEKLRVMAKNYSIAEKKAELESNAIQQDVAAETEKTNAADQQVIAAAKKEEQKSYEKEAEKKNTELKNVQKNQNITTFTVGSLNYKVTNASAKTVTITGPVDKKKAKKVNIAPTVTYQSITWNITEISANAFKGCKSLKKVTFGANITKIGNQAFSGCKKLNNINMKKATKITSFGRKTFKGISAKAKITVAKSSLKNYTKKLKKTGLPKTAKIKK